MARKKEVWKPVSLKSADKKQEMVDNGQERIKIGVQNIHETSFSEVSLLQFFFTLLVLVSIFFPLSLSLSTLPVLLFLIAVHSLGPSPQSINLLLQFAF